MGTNHVCCIPPPHIVGQEEHVHRSYSFSKFGGNFNDETENLKERVDNVWFVDGATSLDGWPVTTVGAWDTGEEAAHNMSSVLEKE